MTGNASGVALTVGQSAPGFGPKDVQATVEPDGTEEVRRAGREHAIDAKLAYPEPGLLQRKGRLVSGGSREEFGLEGHDGERLRGHEHRFRHSCRL